MPSIVIEATWAAAGGDGDHLPRGAAGRRRRSCTTRPRSTAPRIWQKICHVTLPQLRGVLFVTLILQLIATAQLFTEPFLFTGGGPANATMTVLLLIYQLRVPEQPRRRLRHGRRPERACWPSFLGRLHRRLLLAHPVAGARRVALVPATARARRPGEDARRRAGSIVRRRLAPRRRVRWAMRVLHVASWCSCSSSGSARCCGCSSRRSRRPRTPCARRWRCGRTASTSGNLATAWTRTHIDRYFWNTVVIAFGSWVVQIIVATTAGYALSVLRPRFAPADHGPRAGDAVRAADRAAGAALPDDPRRADRALRLINTFWAVWLPAGASAFNVVLMKRFFDNLPREIFEAARVDGAGPVPAVLVDRPADVAADPRRRLGVRAHRDLEGLPVAAAGAPEPGGAAALGAPADLQPTTELDIFIAALTISMHHPDRPVPGLPADVPARRGPVRSDQGLIAVTGRGRRARVGRWPTRPPSRRPGSPPCSVARRW